MRALVLGGGGIKAAFQAGFLHSHSEGEGFSDYDIIAGTSAGAIGAAFLASSDRGKANFKCRVGEYARFWENELTSERDLYKRRFLGWLSGYFKMSLYKTEPLRDLISKNVDVDLIRSNGRFLRVGVWDATRDIYFEARESDPMILEMIRASSAFPMMLEPVKVGDDVCADGGVKNNVPNLFLLDFPNLEAIDIVLCSPIGSGVRERAKLGTVKDMAIQVIKGLLSEAGVNDLMPFLNYNFKYPDCRIRICEPCMNFNVTLKVNQEDIRNMYNAGRVSEWMDFLKFWQDRIIKS